MFFRSSFVVTAILAATQQAFAVPTTLSARGVKPECLPPTSIDISCYDLVAACQFFVSTQTSNQLWHQKACVAAATCFGVGNLLNKVSCQLGVPVTNAQEVSLDYNIYAGIVGNCAWDPNGCPITQQNYIDFYYGTLSELNSNEWPSSPNVVIGWWNAIKAWTATGDTIPYLNFNDWLHYSTYASGVVTGISSSPVPVTSTVPAIPVSSSVSHPITLTSSAGGSVTTAA